jgi:hypothetical protein
MDGDQRRQSSYKRGVWFLQPRSEEQGRQRHRIIHRYDHGRNAGAVAKSTAPVFRLSTATGFKAAFRHR